MKKQRKRILFAVTCLVCAFTLGFFLGRNLRHTTPTLTLVTAGETVPAGQRLDINTATAAELASLPGIGNVLAQRILDYRAENGDFQTIADLLKVNGLGEAKLEDILDLITVGGQP